MQQVRNPFPIYLDARGLLLDGGNIYIGIASGDPYNNPGERLIVYSDAALTDPIAQPIRTLGGYAVNGTNQILMFIDEDDYSEDIRDEGNARIGYSASVYTNLAQFQAASVILDHLVANGDPTVFGLSLLLLANAGALATVLGGLNYLPLAGGTMTGYATHQGAGVEPFWADAAMTSGKIYITDSGDPDPTTGDGDIWLIRA